MQHYPHDIHTHTCTMCIEKSICGPCLRTSGCLKEADPGLVIVDLWPFYPIKGYDGLTEEMLCPPSMWGALMFTVKERFQYNQVSARHRCMLNALARRQCVGQEVVTDICTGFHTCGVFYRVWIFHVKCLFLRVWPRGMRIRICVRCAYIYIYISWSSCMRLSACVRVWYSFQILSKAWFPLGNDRGHLIGEGWKQHLHPIGHTHDIKVLARQKHVKEIYIAALTAPHTRGHRPLPLPIIKVTVHLLCVNSTVPITNKNITGRFFFFLLCHLHYHPLHPFCVYQAANQN